MAGPLTAARRYAEAAFEVGLRDDELDRWRDDLATAADILGRPEVAPIVHSPAVPLQQRKNLVAGLLESRIQPGALRLVDVLMARGRVSVLARVSEEFVRLLNTHRGVVMATVSSAVPLSDAETAAIRDRAEAMAGSAVDLRSEVDASLIGGITIQIRDQLLDASIRGRLERLRDQLHAGGHPR
jgi:ATP synthase F1 delta subunit